MFDAHKLDLLGDLFIPVGIPGYESPDGAKLLLRFSGGYRVARLNDPMRRQLASSPFLAGKLTPDTFREGADMTPAPRVWGRGVFRFFSRCINAILL